MLSGVICIGIFFTFLYKNRKIDFPSCIDLNCQVFGWPVFYHMRITDADINLHTHVRLIIIHFKNSMSHVMRKPAVCVCGSKGANQLHSKRPAD